MTGVQTCALPIYGLQAGGVFLSGSFIEPLQAMLSWLQRKGDALQDFFNGEFCRKTHENASVPHNADFQGVLKYK